MIWVNGCWSVPNVSGGYHMLFVNWWKKYQLRGRVLFIGENYKHGGDILKEKVRQEFPAVDVVHLADLKDADILWDITRPPIRAKDAPQYDAVICQAVLEHLAAPALAIINAMSVLRLGGLMFIQVCSPDFPYHAHPVDCLRFFKDTLFEWAKLTEMLLVEEFYQPPQVMAVYQKTYECPYKVTWNDIG